MAKTIAAMIVDSLIKAGVRRVHGIVGDSLNGITDEIRKSGKIEWIHYRHEEAAAFAAGAEAQLTGQLAVCAGSCGPGHLHLINGLYDCNRSGAPVLAIAAHVPSSEIGTSYFQETHPELIFQECSKYCETIASGRQMPRVLQIAMQHAISLKGVAVIALSGDVALEEVPDDALIHDLFSPEPVVRPSNTELQQLADLLNGTEKVTLLCGAGCAGAHDELLALGERRQAPMVYALRGKEYVEYDNPYAVGLTGLIGLPSGHHAIEAADVLLMLGTDFPYPDWYPANAKIIQIDLRPERLGRRSHLELGLVGAVQPTLEALLPLLKPNENGDHLKRFQQFYADTREALDKKAVEKRNGDLIHPQLLMAAVSELANEDAIFTCDVGTPTIWAARYLRMTRERRLIGSFSHGSMACAMPQAIGLQLVDQSRQVIALSGDGGITMLLGDLITISQYNLPVKIVIFNNQSLAFVDIEMKAAGISPFGVDLKNVNYAQIAEAMGIRGFRAQKPDDVHSVIREALAHPGPALIDVMVNPTELSMPPEINLKQAWGFSLYMAKEVLRGNGEEVLQTITSNFLKR